VRISRAETSLPCFFERCLARSLAPKVTSCEEPPLGAVSVASSSASSSSSSSVSSTSGSGGGAVAFGLFVALLLVPFVAVAILESLQ
jgi:hypothetical protein